MKKIYLIVLTSLGVFLFSGCLKHGYEELPNSSDKELTAVNYTYRFLYNDTIQKGTPSEEILKDRVCEVVFSKKSTKIDENGVKGFSTVISHNLNSVMKSGPTGIVTKEMLYAEFKSLIEKDQLTNLWVYVTISDVAKLVPLDGAPVLGKPGDFSKDRTYKVVAADGSSQDYVLKTIKDF